MRADQTFFSDIGGGVSGFFSGLGNFAKAEGDRLVPRLLYPRRRTCAVQLGMSALCQKQT
jgi:hypothetical protein